MKINFVLQPFFIYKNTGPHTYIKGLIPFLREKNIKVGINDFNNNYDIIHVHDILPRSIILAKLNKGVTVTTTHALPSTMKGMTPNFLDKRWKKYFKIFYNSFDKVIANSLKSKKEIKKIGVKGGKIEYLRHSINLKEFRPDKKKRDKMRKKLGIEKDDVVVYCVSRIEPRKGFFEFIKTANSLPELKFVWFGQFPRLLTPRFSKINKQIKNKPPNVMFTGVLKDMVSAHNAGDIFFFPSWGESLGLAILEAAACGKPVLLKNLDDFTMFDFSIKYDSQEDCIKKIKRLLNKKYYNHYKKLSLKKIKKFEMKEHVEGLVEIYEKALK